MFHCIKLRSALPRLASVFLFVLAACSASDPIQSTTSAIVGGVEVGTCGFPTTVIVGQGCTGTLIHPRVVVSAAHCGLATSVSFGERRGSGIQRRVSCANVPQTGGTGSDVMFCILDEAMTVPITPVLYGCELERLSVGEQVVITGFGLTSFQNQSSGGIQRWSNAPIRDIRGDVTLIGTPQASACPGDSGGPVFIRMEDQSWRVFGTVSGGTTGIPCNGDGAYPRIERHVPWFETNFNIDITPCHDADGTWNPGPDCKTFFAGDHTGGQSWSNQCAGAPVGPVSATCGAPIGGSPDAGVPDAMAPDADGPIIIPDASNPSQPDSSTSDATTGDASNPSADEGTDTSTGAHLEAGCAAIPGDHSKASLFAFLLLAFVLRKRQ